MLSLYTLNTYRYPKRTLQSLLQTFLRGKGQSVKHAKKNDDQYQMRSDELNKRP